MDEAIGTAGMVARWRCARCAVILLGEHGSPPAGPEFAQRDPLVRRLLGLPRADAMYCVCNECGMEWPHRDLPPSERDEGAGIA